jgi:hypothetical protein
MTALLAIIDPRLAGRSLSGVLCPFPWMESRNKCQSDTLFVAFKVSRFSSSFYRDCAVRTPYLLIYYSVSFDFLPQFF